MRKLLTESKFDSHKTHILLSGFTEGFDIGYAGPRNRQVYARNHRLTVGTPVDLWNKVMKEVKEKRYVGPLREIKFDHFVQSPLGKQIKL